MLKRELGYFCAALIFYTRIPCPARLTLTETDFNKSLKYLALIGWVIGGIGVGTLLLFRGMLPLSVSLLLSIAATILATGAFHEDGFADTCDAFGGGTTPEQILHIMKDSRVGAYGVLGIGILMGIKFLTLYEIGLISLPILVIAYFNGHITSRFIALTFVQTHPYVQSADHSKSKAITAHRLSSSEMIFSFAMMAAGWFLFTPYYWMAAAFPIAYLAKIYLAHYFYQRIGGYTGDCLGATQQVSEVMFYLAVLALCRFI